MRREKFSKRFFHKHAEEIRNYLYYKSGNLVQSEDLTQDAFAKLWENCVKVSFDRARAFLYKVARNTFFNEIEHQKVVLKFERKPRSDKDNQTPQFFIGRRRISNPARKGYFSITCITTNGVFDESN